MSNMFSGCISLSSLNLSTFNTSSVTDMGWMFSGCSSLSSLDLSTFNTSNARNVDNIFDGCSKLEEVYVKDKRIKSELPAGASVKTK